MQGLHASHSLPEGLGQEDVKDLKDPNYAAITGAAMRWSDALIVGTQELHPQVEKELKKSTKPVLGFHSPEEYIDAIDNFYQEVLLEDTVLVD